MVWVIDKIFIVLERIYHKVTPQMVLLQHTC